MKCSNPDCIDGVEHTVCDQGHFGMTSACRQCNKPEEKPEVKKERTYNSPLEHLKLGVFLDTMKTLTVDLRASNISPQTYLNTVVALVEKFDDDV